METINIATYRLIDLTTGLTEFEGTYSECRVKLRREGTNGLLKINETVWDENGEVNYFTL